ncbi:MAG TPA: hypothetical protein VES67_05225, partial [Vicinamibacterales bacterium]|nr:hypothetical protein [Vicinamibacterales bacterium]
SARRTEQGGYQADAENSNTGRARHKRLPAIESNSAAMCRPALGPRQPWGFIIAVIAGIQGSLYLLVLSVNSIVAIQRGLADAPAEARPRRSD